MTVQTAAMKIPLIKPDLPTLAELSEAVEEVLTNGKLTNFGKYVRQFEEHAGDYLGSTTVSTSSGTMALVFALSGLGLQPGQKVIVPSFTFMATAQAILYAGGIPVFAEVDEDLNLCPSDLEQLLERNEDAGAVIAVHMYGLPARVHEIERSVERASVKHNRKIPLIFDAAHAFGASVDGRRIGSFGDAEVFSLSITKVLVSVEGGLVSTRNLELVERLRCMRNYGIRANYDAAFPGMNGKMSEIHAIVGLHNLHRLNDLIAERQVKARCFRERIRAATSFELIEWPENVVHTFKDLTIRVNGNVARDAIMHHLSDRGIETRAYFCPPVHEQVYFERFADRPLPKTERFAREVITLPFYTGITVEEMDYVVDALQRAEKELA